MKKIFICGDPHGSFDHIVSAIDEYHPESVVILGDLTPEKPLDEIFKDCGKTQVYWIPGNHDTDSDLIYDRLYRSRFSNHNLNGKVLDVGRLKVAGLGGVFRGQIWMPPGKPNYFSPTSFIRKVGKSGMWRGGLPRRHRSTIFASTYERLSGMKADMLVTHEAPSMHAKGFKAIDDLAHKLGVKYIFHAHQHESCNYGVINGIVARGVGLRGIVDLEGNIIVPAQVDPREIDTFDDKAKKNFVHHTASPYPERTPSSHRRERTPLRHKTKWLKNRRRKTESHGQSRRNGQDRSPQTKQ